MSEELNELKINLSTMKKDIKYIKESLSTNKEEHDKILEKIDKWIETSERRFAPKQTADVIKWTGVIVGATVITALLSLTIK